MAQSPRRRGGGNTGRGRTQAHPGAATKGQLVSKGMNSDPSNFLEVGGIGIGLLQWGWGEGHKQIMNFEASNLKNLLSKVVEGG